MNHSDVAGGSTLGNILTSQIDLRGVDMGAAIWAMHSVRETASCKDHVYIYRAFSKFFWSISSSYYYRSARMGLVRKSLYANSMPLSSVVLGIQPNALARLTSSSLRGVPLGRVVSHCIFPV